MKLPQVHVRLRGEFALFTRPEAKVERMSYPIITPSAARGAVEAVMWKPEMRYVVERIVVFQPPKFQTIKRNEVSKKVPATFVRWPDANRADGEIFADRDRQQRNALVLCGVDYVVTVRIELTPKAKEPADSVGKYVGMLARRLESGQCYTTPYLGCREFPADADLATGDERPDPALADRLTQDFGLILHDIEYGADGRRRAHFFHAKMVAGVIDVPPVVPVFSTPTA